MALGQLACATMSHEQAPSTEHLVSTRQVPEIVEPSTTRITQDGALVQIRVDRACRFRAHNQIETTQHFETVNKSAWVDWTLGLTGTAIVGIGGWMYADASKVYPNDTASRTYNETGPDAARGIGAATMLTGGLLLGIAVVDVLRAQGTEDRRQSVHEREGGLLGACPSEPFAGVRIDGRFARGGGDPIYLGLTNSEGEAHVNLADASPPNPSGDIAGEPYGADLVIFVGGKPAGKAALSSAYPVWRQAWQRQRAEAAREQAEAARVREAQCRVQRTNGLAEMERLIARKPQPKCTNDDVELWKRLMALSLELRGLVGCAVLAPEAASGEELARKMDLMQSKMEADCSKRERVILRERARVAERAEREAAANVAANTVRYRAACVQCCLTENSNATRDHCEAACNNDLESYLLTVDISLGRIFCRRRHE